MMIKCKLCKCDCSSGFYLYYYEDGKIQREVEVCEACEEYSPSIPEDWYKERAA